MDGLRAFAVVAVMFFHARAPFSELGMLGVDLFFVLSGFLITSLMLDEHSRTGRIDLIKFWARRFLRLAPAYWLYIAGVTLAIASGLGWTQEKYGWTASDLVRSFWLYYCNYAPWPIWEHQVVTAHLWSLAVEEQFYLLWPLILTMALSLGLTRKSTAIATWVLVAGMAARNILVPPYMDLRLEMRGLAIVVGCAFALSMAAWPGLAEVLGRRRVGETAAAAVLLLLIVATLALRRGVLDMQVLWAGVVPVLAVGLAIVVGYLWRRSEGPLDSALSWRPLVRIGRISYGLYLYHFLVLHLTGFALPGMEASHPGLYKPIRMVVYLVGSYLLAYLSYRFVEAGFLRLKSHLRPHGGHEPAKSAA
ncbi:acyltransferase family protein [Paludisphaera rhizosphaerae]|uniref:acyltransferase family protein n=1 Tax=Paludisphaera rhizosphaerae TaxID=2711216 RepID=UPI0013E9CAD2|nr:acyltransferase [Paludisphaera rhizosphaerae]